jgi:hypothetical protein
MGEEEAAGCVISRESIKDDIEILKKEFVSLSELV